LFLEEKFFSSAALKSQSPSPLEKNFLPAYIAYVWCRKKRWNNKIRDGQGKQEFSALLNSRKQAEDGLLEADFVIHTKCGEGFFPITLIR